jgi:hypothetical protein
MEEIANFGNWNLWLLSWLYNGWYYFY